MSGRVIVLGSLNVDLVTRVRRHPGPGETVLGEGHQRIAGGKGGNQAVAAAASGADVRFVGAVGEDEAGAAYLARLAGRGVDVHAVRIVPGATGHALVVVDEEGENTIVVIPGANAAVGPEVEAALSDLGHGDVLLMQLELPLDTVATAARAAARHGARVVLNAAPYAELPADVIALADPLIVNEHEARLLAASGVEPGSLVVTLGSRGSAWGEITVAADSVPLDEVTDTTGAGDAFCGALAAALAKGLDRGAALRVASQAGAAAVRHLGAQPDPFLG